MKLDSGDYWYMDLSLISLKNSLAYGIWGPIGDSYLEIYIMFLPLSFPYQVVLYAQYIKMVVVGRWGNMDHEQVCGFLNRNTLRLLYLNPHEPPRPSGLLLEWRCHTLNIILILM